MTNKEYKELKKLTRFFWNKAKLLENRLQDADLIEFTSITAKADTYKFASTLLSVKLDKVKCNGNSKDDSIAQKCKRMFK